MPIAGPFAAVAFVQAAAFGAAWLLRSREQVLRRQLPLILSVAVGVLLATALFHLMPEAVAALGNGPLVWSLFGGTMFALFAAERMFYVFTGAGTEPELSVHTHTHASHSTRPASLIGASMLHSLVDGAAVAVAFLTGPRLGWITAVAVGLHEIPHRMGDFAVLVHLRVPIPRALRLSAIVGIPSLLGVAAVLTADQHSSRAVAMLIPVSAGSFLYIGIVNLLPELQIEGSLSRALLQLALLAAGGAVVALL